MNTKYLKIELFSKGSKVIFKNRVEMLSQLNEHHVFENLGMRCDDTHRSINFLYKRIILFINGTDLFTFQVIRILIELAQKLKIVLIGPASASEPALISFAGN